MELTFQTSPLRFLRCFMQEVHFQEETSDTIVPDSFPDIGSIADCYADVILRGKDCRDHSVIIAGGIKGGILYLPEDDATPRCLDIYIPFTMRFDNSELSETSQVLCSMRVRSVDARMINSRKANLRVEIGCELEAFENGMEELYELVEPVSDVQTKYNTYRVDFPLETGEKSFLIQETLDFSGHPPVEQICKLRYELLQADQKVVGNKAIFKGSLICKLLYLTSDHTLHMLQHVFPYSQFCELSQEYDDENVQILPIITGFDLEPDQSATPTSATVQVHVLAQCIIRGHREIRVLSDAYSTVGMLEPVWKEYEWTACLDVQCASQTVRSRLNGEINEVFDTDVYWDYPVIRRENDTIRVSVPAMIYLLTNEQGRLQQKKVRDEAVQEFVLADHCVCHAEATPSGELYTTLIGDTAEVRCGIQISTECCAESSMRAIMGATINEEAESGDHRSMIIVRTVPADTLLWDLAKTYRTTEQEIMSANNLNTDHITDDTMIIVPVL